jgi:hypothetical protein
MKSFLTLQDTRARSLAPQLCSGSGPESWRRCITLVLAGLVIAATASAFPAPPAEASQTDSVPAAKVFPKLSSLPQPKRLAVVSEVRPKGRENYLALLTREAQARDLPPAVADAVANVESGYDPSRRSATEARRDRAGPFRSEGRRILSGSSTRPMA